MSDSGDRTIPATPRRREAARRQGMMPTSAPLAWAVAAAVAIWLVPAWGRATVPAAVEMIRQAVVAATAPSSGLIDRVPMPPPAVLLPAVGLVVAAAAAGLAVRVVCDGLGWHPGRLVPELHRIDPLAGLARIFSGGTAAAVLGSGLGLVVLVAVSVGMSGPLLAAPDGFGEMERAAAAAWRPLAALALAAVGVAACHYALVRLRFERRIRMTPQELADEQKSMQADPKVRLLQQGRRRAPASAA